MKRYFLILFIASIFKNSIIITSDTHSPEVQEDTNQKCLTCGFFYNENGHCDCDPASDVEEVVSDSSDNDHEQCQGCMYGNYEKENQYFCKECGFFYNKNGHCDCDPASDNEVYDNYQKLLKEYREERYPELNLHNNQ